VASEKSHHNRDQRGDGKDHPGKMGNPEPINTGNEKECGEINVDCSVGDRALLDLIYREKQEKNCCYIRHRRSCPRSCSTLVSWTDGRAIILEHAP
jgi:hypothetical protein